MNFIDRIRLFMQFFCYATCIFFFTLLYLPSQSSVKSQEKIQQSENTEPVDWYNDAMQLYIQGKYQESTQLIMKQFPKGLSTFEGKAHLLAGMNYLKLDDFTNSKTHINIGMYSKDPNIKKRAYLLKSFYYRKAKYYNRAIYVAASGLKYFEKDLDAKEKLHLEIALSSYELLKIKDARYFLRLILAANPENIQALYLDGLIFLRQKKWGSAEFRFRNSLALMSHTKQNIPEGLAMLYNNLAFTLEQKNANTLSHLELAMQKDSEIYQEVKNFYAYALQLDKSNPTILSNYARFIGLTDIENK